MGLEGCIELCFNSRLREEATGEMQRRLHKGRSFNSRLREEATCRRGTSHHSHQFQLTPP